MSFHRCSYKISCFSELAYSSSVLVIIFSTIASIVTNKASFSQESWDESSKMMKSPKKNLPWGLGCKNYIWTSWAEKTYPIISPEPWLEFLRTETHFLKNHEINPMKLCNLKNVLPLWAGIWKLHLGQLSPEDVSSHECRTLAPIFTNRTSFSKESWDESNKFMISQRMSLP